MEIKESEWPPKECEAGCSPFSGGDIRHDPHCKHYPDSMTFLLDQCRAENELLRSLTAQMHPILDNGAEPIGDELVDRLSGIYVIPVNDGAGLLNGKSTFTRHFATGTLCKKAADEIIRLREELKMTQIAR